MKLNKVSALSIPYGLFAILFIVAPLLLILFYSVSYDVEIDDGTSFTLPAESTIFYNDQKLFTHLDIGVVTAGTLTMETEENFTAYTSEGEGCEISVGECFSVEDGASLVDDEIGRFVLTCSGNKNHGKQITLRNFFRFFDRENPQYCKTLLRSFVLAIISTIICLILGYPMAYILSRLRSSVRGTLTFLFILPMWMNFLLRTYAWMTILENTGLINTLLQKLNLPTVSLMYTKGAVILGMVYNFLPFMILPIYNQLIRIDKSLMQASEDLGANGVQTFLRVVFPLSLPGVVSGITMTFMPAVTTFVISKLLGGGQNALVGDLIEQQFKTAGDWGFGSAISVIVMVLMLLCMAILSRYEDSQTGGGVLR